MYKEPLPAAEVGCPTLCVCAWTTHSALNQPLTASRFCAKDKMSRYGQNSDHNVPNTYFLSADSLFWKVRTKLPNNGPGSPWELVRTGTINLEMLRLRVDFIHYCTSHQTKLSPFSETAFGTFSAKQGRVQ
jgi:hypothetical protein